MVIMKVGDEYPFQISKHAPSLQAIDLADHVLAAAVDQKRGLGIGHDQARRAELVPPTRRGLPQIGCHRHPFDLGIPKHSASPFPKVLLTPVPPEGIRPKIGSKQPAKPGLKSLDVTIRIEDDGSTSGHDDVQVPVAQGLEALDHIGRTSGVPVIAASLGFLDGVLEAVQVKDPPALVQQVARECDSLPPELDDVRNRSSGESRRVDHFHGQSAPFDAAAAASGFLDIEVAGKNLRRLLCVVMEPSSLELVPEPFSAIEVREFGGRGYDSRAVGGEVQSRPDHIATVMGEKDLLDVGE